jgi:hypothetical protein
MHRTVDSVQVSDDLHETTLGEFVTLTKTDALIGRSGALDGQAIA